MGATGAGACDGAAAGAGRGCGGGSLPRGFGGPREEEGGQQGITPIFLLNLHECALLLGRLQS